MKEEGVYLRYLAFASLQLMKSLVVPIGKIEAGIGKRFFPLRQTFSDILVICMAAWVNVAYVRIYQGGWRRAVVDHSGCDRMDSSSLAWAISGSSISSIASSGVRSRPSHSCFQASCLWPLSLLSHRSLRLFA